MKRRDFLAGAISTLPVAACAEVRPPARAGRPVREISASEIIGGFGISANTGFVVADLANGRILEQHNANLERPPASVTKAVTSLYAGAKLGTDYRFETSIAASGPIVDGRVQGDLYLIGGGDPHLDSDSMAELAQTLAAAGVRGISGRFYVVDSALPHIRQIDDSQPVQVGYNPSISGLNLNFNRVYFEWKKANGQYNVTMDARAERHRPAVNTSAMQIVNRSVPTYAFQQDGPLERWSVARGALGDGGGRWLPVRDSGAYAGAVFRSLASSYGVSLPAVERRAGAAGAAVIARQLSRPLREIQRSMLYFSTNMTAEVLGLRATQTNNNVSNLRASGRQMGRWAQQQMGAGSPEFFNHSGLTDKTKLTANEMVALLKRPASQQGLAGLMKRVQMVTPSGDATTVPGVEVFAKTGTLNFTRGLAGYIETAGRQKLAFAIFAADMNARRAAPVGEERPRGARSWSRNARAQEKALLYRWATQFA